MTGSRVNKGTIIRAIAAAGVLGGASPPGLAGDGLEDMLRDSPRLERLVADAEQHRFQLLVSTMDESSDPPRLVRRGFRVDEAYFYPASSIKLCAAVGALLRIQELNDAGVGVDADTPMLFHPLFDGETVEEGDESNLEGGAITVAHEIRKLFIVSDNRAFNRLLGFVGRDRLNRMMHEAGLASVRVNHRLSVGYSTEQNRHMPRVDLLLGDGAVHTIGRRLCEPVEPNAGVPGLEVGSAEMVGGERLERPKSFRFSNRISLVDLQDALVMVVRPDVDLGKPGFGLTEAHRALLLDAMGRLPRESANPVYDPSSYPDEWVKFLLPGLRRACPGRTVREINKIGLAYGFTSTTSAIGVGGEPPRVFVAGTMYTNANGTLNDDDYEYDETALPAWGELGELIGRAFIEPAAGADGADD